MTKFFKEVRNLRAPRFTRFGVAVSALLLGSGGLASCGSSTSGGGTGGGAGEGSDGAAGDTGGTAGEGAGGRTNPGEGGEGGALASGDLVARKVPVNNTTQIDLLFVVDNSSSMADKQAVLKQAVPAMLGRFVTPNCVERNAEGDVIYREAGVREGSRVNCSRTDLSLEAQPISDIHIGVITSSLGSHGYVGALSCDEASANAEKNDHARLIPLVRPDDPNLAGQPPFLTWNGDGDEAALGAEFANHVSAAGSIGCGLESTHEAWYRFLVDPEPPSSMSLTDNKAVRGPVDEEVLSMRREFLRPGSLVAIVVLTDENDCSAMDGGSYYDFAEYGYLTGEVSAQKNAEPTDICATNPNDKCCQTCIDTPNAGCEDQFAKCPDRTNPPRLSAEEDQNNVRCFQNQRRFGFDLLYPVGRYIAGLSRTEVRGADGNLFANPLVAGRESGLVFFAGITGIPWQDLATPDTLNKADELTYITADELAGPVDIDGVAQPYTYWDLILGKPGKHAESNSCKDHAKDDGTFDDPECGALPVLPLDPFMVESIEPRTGLASQTNARAKISITTSPTWNAINGYEYNTAGGDAPNNDLQYSCIFPLGPFNGEKTAEECADRTSSCDCETSDSELDKPLCKRQPGDEADGGQFWGKAYPSTRTLEILKGFGANAIAASICPKVTESKNLDYGYNPAVKAIADRLTEKLGAQCLPSALVADEATGEVPCALVEARPKAKENIGIRDLDCGLSGRQAVPAKVRQAVLDELEKSGSCSFKSTPQAERKSAVDCDSYQMCSIEQLDGNSVDGQYCLDDPGADSDSPGDAGFCYIDDDSGNPDLLSECPPSERQRFRLIHPESAPTPQENSILFFACGGESD